MTAMTTGNTSRADTNRRRILDVALAELLRDPDASMDQIARAAGVVRRTVYGHFPSREALIGTLVDEAVQALTERRRERPRGGDRPGQRGGPRRAGGLGDRRPLPPAGRPGPAHGHRRRASATASPRCARRRRGLLQRGLDEGVFSSPLPAAALAFVHEQLLFAVMEAVNEGCSRPRRRATRRRSPYSRRRAYRPDRAEELVVRASREA